MMEWIVFGFLLLLQIYFAYLGIKVLLWLDKTYKIKFRVSVLIFLSALGGWMTYQKYVYDPFYCSQEKRYLSDQEFIDDTTSRLIDAVAHSHKLAYEKSPNSDEYIYSEDKYQKLSLKIKRYIKEHPKSRSVSRNKNDTIAPIYVTVEYMFDTEETQLINDYLRNKHVDKKFEHNSLLKKALKGEEYAGYYWSCGKMVAGISNSIEQNLQNKQLNKGI